jgi:hypothetical protein
MAKKTASSSQSALPSLGILKTVLVSVDRQTKDARALQARLEKRAAAPGSAVAGMAAAPDALTPLVAPFIADVVELESAGTRLRGLVAQATSAKKVTDADLTLGREQVGHAKKLFEGLMGLHADIYAKPFGEAFPDQAMAKLSKSDSEVGTAVKRVLLAIEGLPEAKQGALHELLAPLHATDAKLHQGGDGLSRSYEALRVAEAKVARHVHLVHLAAALLYADAPELLARLFPAAKAKAAKPEAAVTPAPK